MAGRFSDIKRGGDLKKKLDKYVTYLQNPPARRLNTQGDRKPSTVVYLTPFSLDVGTTQVVSVDANRDGYTLLAPFVNQGTGSAITNDKDGKTVKDVGRFRAAKVNVFQNPTKTKTTPNSKFTGEPYLKYAGNSYSCPFGRKAASDDIQDAFSDVKAILRQRQGLLVNRVSLQIERVYAS
jgi:hypothetical protein